MIALLLGLAFADPCAREVVVGRGLVVATPEALVAVEATLDLRLVIRSRRVDGIRSFYVREARLDWAWALTTTGLLQATAAVGEGGALCEGEVEVRLDVIAAKPGELAVPFRLDSGPIDACRVRVVLKDTVPVDPVVRLRVVGPRPPGPDAPVSGPLAVNPGSDLVIDIPACL